MSDIVVLSLVGDEDAAHPLADALVEDRLDAFWLPLQPDNSNLADATAAIHEARCVVLCWTEATTTLPSEAFLALARLAVCQAKAISCLLEPTPLPDFADDVSLYDLRGWRSRPEGWRKWFDGAISSWLGGNLYMRDYVNAVRYKVAGRDPPPPTASTKMLRRQLLAVIPAAFAITMLVPTIYGFLNDLGVTDLPGAEASKAYAEIDKGKCDQLRRFVSRYPDDPLAAEAQARLDGRHVTTVTQWEALDRKQPLYVGDGIAQPAPSKSAALDDLTARMAHEARRTCDGIAEAGHAKPKSYTISSGNKTCSLAGDGHRCVFDGDVVCRQEEPRDVDIESCAVDDAGQ